MWTDGVCVAKERWKACVRVSAEIAEDCEFVL